ncbi:MAG: hypothetical protein QM680_14025, partial [Luteolibacter sp.]
KEWSERKHLLTGEYPEAHWKNYDDARAMLDVKNGYVRADAKPDWHDLSDAGRGGEMNVPTWAELAEKYGAKRYIGFLRGTNEAALYVEAVPLREADIAAHNDSPGECVFSHPLALQQAKKDAEKRKIEREAKMASGKQEMLSVLKMIEDGKLSKSAEKKFAEGVAVRFASEVGYDGFMNRFPIPENPEAADCGYLEKKVREFMRQRDPSGYELLGKLVALYFADLEAVNDSGLRALAALIFQRDAFRRADFPTIASMEPGVADVAAEAAAQEETADY